jgi:tRNA 5-methylaminomethyl-2-thiouridine biosynthesis bifunctional protein
LIHDFLIIGGGIAGASIGYFLHKAGYSVTILEKRGLGFGGSGAAGAFLNWKLEKEGDLAKLNNVAVNFSLHFYEKYFPQHLHKSPSYYHLSDGDVLNVLSGLVDAKPILNSMSLGYKVNILNLKELRKIAGVWNLHGIEGRNIIFATGAFPFPIKEPYIKIRPIWGQRIDVYSPTKTRIIQHQDVSVSHNIKGIHRIGATHHRNILHKEIDYTESESLLKKALNIVELEEVQMSKTYSGVRSASTDYFPLLGKIVNSAETINKYPQIQHGRAYSKEEYVYYKNMYLFTGFGGHGYSLAPYLSYRFVQSLVKNKNFFLDDFIEPHRFFTRWVKRNKT